MVKRVDIVFKRTGNFTQRGYASVDVEEGHDWREQAYKLNLAEFLPSSMIYENEDWQFDTIFIEEDNDNPDT
jgi:hypothetical protein